MLIENNSFEESPSFINQHIEDDPMDSKITTIPNETVIKELCQTNLYVYKMLPEIFSASYNSNGEVIDTTLWLNSSINNNFSPLIGEHFFESENGYENITDIKVLYELMLDIISTYDKGIDYSVAIEWDNSSGKWSKKIKQWSSPSDKVKILRLLPYSFPNHEGNNEHEYINFTFNLDQIGYPTDYNILARTYSFVNTTGGLECRTDDLIDLIPVPPPKFDISLDPSSLTLQPGQKGEINIKINSNTNLNSVIYLPDTISYSPEIDVDFLPSNVSLPPNGSGTSTMLVSSLGNTKLSKIIPIVLEAKFPQALTMSALNATEYSDDTGLLLRTFPQIIVAEPPKFFDQIGGIFNSSGLWLQNFAGYITTLGTIITGILGLIAILRRKKDNNNNQTTEKDNENKQNIKKKRQI
jgi:hypothetical protein